MTTLFKWLLLKHTASVAIPFAMLISYFIAGAIEDWNARLIVMFGVGGVAGIILAFAKLNVALATSRKIDATTSSSQWVLIVERLQEENKALSNRLENSNQREALITVSKHDALKANQAMIWHIQNCRELAKEHNANCQNKIDLPEFRFTTLDEILSAEDESRAQFAKNLHPVKT